MDRTGLGQEVNFQNHSLTNGIRTTFIPVSSSLDKGSESSASTFDTEILSKSENPHNKLPTDVAAKLLHQFDLVVPIDIAIYCPTYVRPGHTVSGCYASTTGGTDVTHNIYWEFKIDCLTQDASTQRYTCGEWHSGGSGYFGFTYTMPATNATTLYVRAKVTDGTYSSDTRYWNTSSIATVYPFTTTATSGNYPNPFNPYTEIKFTLTQSTNVAIIIYDVTGRIVNHLTNSVYSEGTHQVTFDASNLPSGTYFYTLKTGLGDTITRQMTLSK